MYIINYNNMTKRFQKLVVTDSKNVKYSEYTLLHQQQHNKMTDQK